MNWKIIRLIDTYIGIPLIYLLYILKKPLFFYRKAGLPKERGKILLMKFWGIGNVIMLLPVAYSLRERYPDAEIDFLTLESNKKVSEFANVFNKIYTFDTKNIVLFIKTIFFAIFKLRQKKYDLLIDFEQFARFSVVISVFINPKHTIGFNTKWQHRHYIYNQSILYSNSIHITESFTHLVKHIGLSYSGCLNSLPDLVKEEYLIDVWNKLLEQGFGKSDTIVLMHIGTSENFKLRRWPVEHYSRLTDLLIDAFDVKVIFTGLYEEKFLAEQVISRVRNKADVFNSSGKLSFNQFIGLIKLSRFVVSSDTSPVHIASLLGVPVVGLYGPNTPVLYGPWGKNKSSLCFYKNLYCSPCITNYNSKINRCKHPKGQGICMKQILPEEVFDAIRDRFFKNYAVLKKESEYV